jgi:HSP20 family protein
LGPLRRQHTSSLTDLFDWFEKGLPSALDWRREGIEHAMRIEDHLEPDRYTVRAELPGIDPDKDVEITVANGALTIAAERREETREKDRTEFRYGSFLRRVTLPAGAQEDGLTAGYRDGILEVAVPIAANRPEPKRIPVTRGKSE